MKGLTHPDRNTQNERKATQSNAEQRTQGKQKPTQQADSATGAMLQGEIEQLS